METKRQIFNYLSNQPWASNHGVLSGMLDSFEKSDNKEEIDLTVTENGKTYTPEAGKVYKKVVVNIEMPIPNTFAVYIDMNGGEVAGRDFGLSSGVVDTYFVADDWYSEMERYITPPTGKVWGGLTKTKDDLSTVIDEEVLHSNLVLYAFWATE